MSPTPNAVDSTHELGHDALHRHGFKAVGRYLPGGGKWKAIFRPEADRLDRGGFGLFTFWEASATAALGGYALGVKHAKRANAAMAEIGAAADDYVIVTVDTSARPELTLPYARGFRATLTYQMACYGSAGVIDAWFNAGLIGPRAGNQTNARGWDSPRRYSAHASMRQRLPQNLPGLGSVDPQEFDPDCPFISWPTGHPAKPAQPPAPEWKAPEFPGRSLRPGAVSHDVAVLKIMLRLSGAHGINLRNEKAAETYGAGTARAVRAAKRRYYRNLGQPIPKRLDAIVGPKTWAWIADEFTVHHFARKA